MKKFWCVEGDSGKRFESYDEAEEAAKRKLGSRPQDKSLAVLEAVAFVKAPVPSLEVVKV